MCNYIISSALGIIVVLVILLAISVSFIHNDTKVINTLRTNNEVQAHAILTQNEAIQNLSISANNTQEINRIVRQKQQNNAKIMQNTSNNCTQTMQIINTLTTETR